MVTLGPRPNVELVFTKIPNVVNCSQTLLLLLLLFTREICQKRVFQPKIRPRRLWRRTESNLKMPFPFTKLDRYFEDVMSVHVSSVGLKSSHFQSHVWPKSAKLGSFWAPSSPGGLIVQPKRITLGLLLFPIPTVVLLLMLTIRTVFSPQRYHSLIPN